MKITEKQKSILYIGIVSILLLALYANIFVKKTDIKDTINVINSNEIKIYDTKHN